MPCCRPGVRGGGSAVRVLTVLLLVSASAGADIDVSEYEFKASLRDRKAREAQLRRIADDQAAEARHAAAAAAAAERQARERQQAEAARPWPERLTEQRCTSCHSAANYTRRAHTVLGWWVVALRMREINGAQAGLAELAVIVPFLAEKHPAGGLAAGLEWSLLPLSAVCLWAATWLGRRLWQRRTTP